jgi:excisionase family DNA binding protein
MAEIEIDEVEQIDREDIDRAILTALDRINRFAMLGAKNALTMDDVSLYTGLSKATIYKMVSGKKIPYYKSQGGKLTYFDKSELEEWMLNRHVPAKEN